MSKDIIVLTPNARRVTVHCTPDTSILQILEDVCKKHGLEAGSFDLKHYNKVMDLSTTLRYSNLPNRACLEMVEATRTRKESNITIGLQLPDGERPTGNFPPNTSLYEVISTLANSELSKMDHPMVVYMRQEIYGAEGLREKTLRQLGLLSGRAIFRLIDKSADKPKVQANVSSIYRSKPQPSTSEAMDTGSIEPTPIQSKDIYENKPETVNKSEPNNTNDDKTVDFSQKTSQIDKKLHNTDPLKLIRLCKSNKSVSPKIKEVITEDVDEVMDTNDMPQTDTREPDFDTALLERRLNIENEVNFIGENKAIAFIPPDKEEKSLEDLPDEFYSLSVEEVRRLYRDLQSTRAAYENQPLTSAKNKENTLTQITEEKLNTYKHAVVRIQFPDSIVLQGVFSPSDTVEQVYSFVKQHLSTTELPFSVFSITSRGPLDPNLTLLEANFVPCVHLHFKWEGTHSPETCLLQQLYTKTTNSQDANILASKYRAPTRRKIEQPSTSGVPTTNKVPKWFKK